MSTVRLPTVRYDTQLLAEDFAAKGLDLQTVAAKAGLHYRTIHRFMTGYRQTIKTMAKLAKVLGHAPSRYVLRSQPSTSQHSVAVVTQ